jgi:hypothetical protein
MIDRVHFQDFVSLYIFMSLIKCAVKYVIYLIAYSSHLVLPVDVCAGGEQLVEGIHVAKAGGLAKLLLHCCCCYCCGYVVLFAKVSLNVPRRFLKALKMHGTVRGRKKGRCER